MIILKHGKLPRAPKLGYMVKCPECKCEFFITDDELNITDLRSDGTAFCTCPDCGERIQFKRKA